MLWLIYLYLHLDQIVNESNQRVMDSNSLDLELGDSILDLFGESTSTLDLKSPFVDRYYFLFWDWMSLLTFACFSTSLPSALILSIYNSAFPDSNLFYSAFIYTSCHAFN